MEKKKIMICLQDMLLYYFCMQKEFSERKKINNKFIIFLFLYI